MPTAERIHIVSIWIVIASLALAPQPGGALHLSMSLPKTIYDRAAVLTDEAKGVATRIGSMLPSAEVIFSSSKNLLLGYPVEALLSAVNLFCSAALTASRVEPKAPPAIDYMNFVLMTRTANHSIGLREPHRLWHHEAFNASRPTAVLVTGWTSNVNKSNSALSAVHEAYMCRGGVNFVAIDTAAYVDTLYEWSAFNTEPIGQLLAAALKELTDVCPVERIHLIGHSLGAHIVGSAGRAYQELTGSLLPRITGLDPANPCFNEGHVLSGLARGDAQFVDIIHSNPGSLGKRDPHGDVDFYPNGLDPLPPGCYSIDCAHSRAYEYYAETVYPGHELSLLGVKCRSMFALNSGMCIGQRQPLGIATPSTVKGNYFLTTNAERPFGVVTEVRCNEEDGGDAELSPK